MNHFEVKGCPVADDEAPCPRCSGGWPATRVTTKQMTKGINAGTINPSRLGCQPLEDKALQAYEKLANTSSPS